MATFLRPLARQQTAQISSLSRSFSSLPTTGADSQSPEVKKQKAAAQAKQNSQRQSKGLISGATYHPDALVDSRPRQQRPKIVTPSQDPFDALGLDPLKEYKNFNLLSNFVSDIGKILPRTQTGITAKNQRKLAKAIKRARAMGLMSSTGKVSSVGSYFGV
ncbi:hypothetical protein INT44_008494 [Umbelopsis vinacea]|uniref:Small ribosomal subunit protein bS18m n=1 Tax=Umbelopsis vinacea TaxID=44442 RepID=A0A8H7PW23_9FUNG|nr:hypothetical protein INT44_008494 [Umbelopsis vinacea]